MNATQEQAIAKLREQQSKQAMFSSAWGVAGQLIDICSRDPAAAEIILPDLDNPEMSVDIAEKEIRKLADEHHKKSKSSAVCVTPEEAETVLRKFYGLPNANAPAVPDPPPAPASDMLSLADFL